MVTCRELLDLHLDAWVARELPPRRVRECEAHVAACTVCAEHVADYRAVVERLRAVRTTIAATPVPDDLVADILADVRSFAADGGSVAC